MGVGRGGEEGGGGGGGGGGRGGRGGGRGGGGRKEGREQHDNCDTRAIQSAELHLSKVQKSSEATSLVRHSVRMRLGPIPPELIF